MRQLRAILVATHALMSAASTPSSASPYAAAATPRRWCFTQPSPLGEVSSSVEFGADALRLSGDGGLGPRDESVRWDEIDEAATAALDLPYGSGRGGPDLSAWTSGRLEWLLLSRRGRRAVMHPLPPGPERDALIAALQERLGARWVGERLPLESARQRFRVSQGADTMKVVGLVVAVLIVLAVALLVFALAASVLMLPAGFAFGAYVFRRGLIGLRDTLHMKNLPVSRVASAAIGRVELEGRVVADAPVPAGASGRPSLWWDLAVDVWSDSHDDGGWQPVLAQHGGLTEVLWLEDATGRVPVWLRDADLLLEQHTWETGRHELPAAGVALLATTAFPWHGGQRLRVRETRMEAGATVYVHGTLDEARQLTTRDGVVDRVWRSLRDGSWRPALLRRLPSMLRLPVGVAIAYFEMMGSIGRGGMRRSSLRDVALPAWPAQALAVWKGRHGHSLIVSDRRESEALQQLQQRSLWAVGIGVVVLCLCLHEAIQMF